MSVQVCNHREAKEKRCKLYAYLQFQGGMGCKHMYVQVQRGQRKRVKGVCNCKEAMERGCRVYDSCLIVGRS